MPYCNRPGCHKCPEPKPCARGRKCPRCQPTPNPRGLTKYELDLKRIKKK